MMTIQNIQLQLLQLGWGFNERHRHPGFRMPVDMAMEEGDARIIDLEADDDVAVFVDEEGVAAHWRLGEDGVRGRSEGWSFAWSGAGTLDYLDSVRVDVEWMGAAVEVDECQFDNAAEGEDDWV